MTRPFGLFAFPDTAMPTSSGRVGPVVERLSAPATRAET
jgi:hypothetical protein